MAARDAIAEGAAAQSVGDWPAARSWFEQAVRDAASAEALAGLGDALFFLGDVRAAVSYRERAYATSRRAGDVEGAAESAIWLCLTYGMAIGNRAAARGWHGRAQSVLVGSDSAVWRAWLDYEDAVLSLDSEHSRELLERALATARTFGDRDLELSALAERGVARVKLGDAAAGLADIDAAMAGVVAGESTDPFTVVMSACAMMTACDITGDVDRAGIWSDAADLLVRGGCPYLFAECRLAHGRVLILRGRWLEAEAELAKASDVARGTFGGLFGRTVAGLAELRVRQGRLEEAAALIEDAGAPVQTALAAASLALRRGEPGTAVALVDRWFHAVSATVPMHAGDHGLSVEAAAALGLKVEALLAQGDRNGAAAAASLLERRHSLDGPGASEAHAALARGRLAQDQAEAVHRFEQALDLFATLRLPLEAARARLELARALADDTRQLAISEARAALTGFDRIGASADADVAAELLRGWGVSGRYVPRSDAPLTRREREVVALLAEGLTNPEIAERLHIARKTVAHHVSAVLTKLGVRNRVEAIRHAERAEAHPPG
jgi:DNA-binding CsgD family transcriptional regulator